MPSPTRDEAAPGEHVEHARDVLVAVGVELLERDAAADGAAAGVVAGQPQQDAARDGLLAHGQARVRRLGQARDRAAHAAGAPVAGQPQAAALAPLPQLEQRGRQQRQRAGLALDVGEQAVDELGLDARPARGAGKLDRAPQLVALHRADEDMVGRHQRTSSGIRRAVAVEVGADGEHDGGVALARPPRRARRRTPRARPRRGRA